MFDYFVHPTWQDEAETRRGECERAKWWHTINSTKRDKLVIFGHFPTSRYRHFDQAEFVILIRHPIARAASHFAFWQQVQPLTDATLRRHPHLAEVKSGELTFERFVQIPYVKHFYRKYYIDYLPEGRAYFYLVEDLVQSFERIWQNHDIHLDASVRLNVTPDKLIEFDEDQVGRTLQDDIALYEQAKSSFLRR